MMNGWCLTRRWSVARLVDALVQMADYAQHRVGYTYQGTQVAVRWRRCVYLNMDIRRAAGVVVLCEVYTVPAQRGKGRAGKALAWLVARCAAAGYTVQAAPQPFGPPPRLTYWQLRRLYQRHGVIVTKRVVTKVL